MKHGGGRTDLGGTMANSRGVSWREEDLGAYSEFNPNSYTPGRKFFITTRVQEVQYKGSRWGFVDFREQRMGYAFNPILTCKREVIGSTTIGIGGQGAEPTKCGI